MKKIDLGKTQLADLYKILRYESPEKLETKKARLFPNGNTQDEVSTTSIFLASLGAIKEYREELLSQLGVNKIKNQNAQLHVFTEIEYESNADRPDGLMVVTSGKNNPIIEWASFVEVKVKNNPIEEEQVKRYAELGKKLCINNVITISNQLTTTPLESPISISSRSINLYHWSWSYLKVTGSRLVQNDMVKDEDHIFILKELRSYFDFHKNLKDFTKMGSDWNESASKIHGYEAKQNIGSQLLDSVVSSYVQEEKDISLQMTDKTAYHVQLVTSPKKSRTEQIGEMLNTSKVITSEFILNGVRKNSFFVAVDFIRQRIVCYTNITIDSGKSQAQTTRIVKMFENIAAPDDMLANAYYKGKRTNNKSTSISSLVNIRDLKDPYPIIEKDYGDEIDYFEIRSEDVLGSRNFQSPSNFVSKLENTVERFITQIMANKK